MSSFEKLFEVIKDRKQNPVAGSYTCYLFEQGVDKILKKVGEECAETIIASKCEDDFLIKEEICDLIYHLFVLMAEQGIELCEIEEILEKRALKIGNLKNMRDTDRNT